MTVKTGELKLSVDRAESEIMELLKRQTGGKTPAYFRILKKSLDARDKSHIFWRYSVEYSLKPYKEPQIQFKKIKSDKKIAVIGSGPAGLFCALRLVEYGLQPIIIERGESVVERAKTCKKFYSTHELDENSNVQFGEGGAGAFSDGKLNTQTKDGLNRDVLRLFARFGAPEEILYLNKPHVGSDKLYKVLQNIRAYIENNGGKYLFNTQFIGFTKSHKGLRSLILKNVKSGDESELEVDYAVLAVGHSARDTFQTLEKLGVSMQAKDFAVGVRIEHLAENISKAQYGNFYKFLQNADYKLVSHAHERSVFTFCMCPGGVVMPAASEKGGIAVNGMSEYARDAKNSNSALMVQIKSEDFGEGDLFAGMRFQRAIERRAYNLTNSYRAPVQLFGDFARDRVSSAFGEIIPSYSAGTVFAPLCEALPKVAVEALKAAIPDMGGRLKGFDCPDAVLTGVETRFSSPVKIVRGDDLQSVSCQGLFPCGEGSGYSGGITSSAADGLKIAEKICEILSK